MLEAFHADYEAAETIHVVNTPIEFVMQRQTLPPQFLLPGLLARCQDWEEALKPDPKRLVVYDTDSLRTLPDEKRAFAIELRAVIEKTLQSENPKALIGRPTPSNRQWAGFQREGLLYKWRAHHGKAPSLAPKILPTAQSPFAEWILRDPQRVLTVSRTWGEGIHAMELLQGSRGFSRLAIPAFTGALRDAHELYQRHGLLYPDWDPRNIAIDAEGNGHLFDFEAVLREGEPLFQGSHAAQTWTQGNPSAKRAFTFKDALAIAGCTLEEIASRLEYGTRNIYNISQAMKAGSGDFSTAAKLLYDLAV